MIFKEFKINDIFVQERGKEASPSKVLDGDVPMIAEIDRNNGFTKYAKPTQIFKGNAITISVNFAKNVFYQPVDFCASVNILILRNNYLNEKNAQYICSVLKKNNEKYDYQNKISKDRLNDTVILLPSSDGINPDYNYMASRISELEQERISELDKYLKATGLNDYKLSKDDLLIVKQKIFLKEFQLYDIFDITSTKSLDAGKLTFVDKGINFVGRTFENNGIQGEIVKQCFEPNESNTITATVIGNYKYAKLQLEEYYCSQNINKLIPRNKSLSKNVLLYLTTFVQKFVSKWDGQQGGYKLEDIKNHIISLPTLDGINPDYQYMEKYIKVIEKLAIKNVVEYKDNVINLTKKVCEL